MRMEEKKKRKIEYKYVEETDMQVQLGTIKEIFNEMIVECGRRCFSLKETEGAKITPAELLCMNRCMNKQIIVERKIRQFVTDPITNIPIIKSEATVEDKTKNLSNNPI